MSVTAIHLTIHGRVQGVGFREWTAQKAFKRDITGWVRNRVEGTVEAVFCGEYEAVELMMADCWHGPKTAKVSHVDSKPWEGEIPEDFQKLATVYHT